MGNSARSRSHPQEQQPVASGTELGRVQLRLEHRGDQADFGPRPGSAIQQPIERECCAVEDDCKNDTDIST